MNTEAREIVQKIQHSLDTYSSWWSPLNLQEMADKLLNFQEAPWCKHYNGQGDISADLHFDLLLSFHSDRYLRAFIEQFDFERYGQDANEMLRDAYIESSHHAEILDRIEALFAHLHKKSKHPEGYLLVAPFNTHPRFNERIEKEAARLGNHQFMTMLWQAFGAAAWPVMLAWKAPEFSCRGAIHMRQAHYHKLNEIYEQFMDRESLILHIVKDFQGPLINTQYWAKEVTLEELKQVGAFTSEKALLLGQSDSLDEDMAWAFQRFALLKASSCPKTQQVLKTFDDEEIQQIRSLKILDKKTVYALDWPSAAERRRDLESDMGL